MFCFVFVFQISFEDLLSLGEKKEKILCMYHSFISVFFILFLFIYLFCFCPETSGHGMLADASFGSGFRVLFDFLLLD